MKKIILFLFLGLFLIPAKLFSQANTCDCFIPLDTLFQEVPMTLGANSAIPPHYYNDVNTSQAIKLPFNFCFYGTNYDTVYIGNKGIISFVKPIFRFTNGILPAGSDTMIIAPFWADINNTAWGIRPPTAGQIWYRIYPKYLVIEWYQVCYYVFDDDLYNTFQLIISNGTDPIIPGGNNVQFCYETDEMQWASADSSGGKFGFNGIPATVGINKGDNKSYAIISRFSLPGLTYYGPDSSFNGLYWLDGKSLLLNTCVTEENIPPVIVNPDVCDTINCCQNDSVNYSVSFLCAEQGQKATLAATAPTLAGIVANTSSGSNSIGNINLKIYTGASVVGYHTINVTATDNSTPPQTSTFPVVVNVIICDGINEVTNSSGFSVYPNANTGKFTIQLDNGLPPNNNRIIIYDMLGKEVYSELINDHKTDIDLSSNSKGMYFLKLCNEDTLLGIKKIVIQ